MRPTTTSLATRRRGGARADIADGSVVSAPTRTDPIARSSSQIIGGPQGRFAARGVGPWPAISVLILLAGLTMVGALVSKQHCRANGWSNPDQFWHACYTDTAVLYSSAQLGGPQRPALHDVLGPTGMGQEPVTGAAMWAVSGVVHAIWGSDAAPTQAEVLKFFDVSAVVLTLAFIVTVVATALAAGRRRVWDAAHVALAPIVLSVGLVSYELMAPAFVALALWAWSRRWTIPAGLLLALAIGSRPVAAILLVVFIALGFRARRMPQALVTVAAAAVGWVIVRVLLFANPVAAMGETWRAWQASSPGYGSLWLTPQLIQQALSSAGLASGPVGALSARSASLLTIVALSITIVATCYVALTVPHRPRIAHVALFAVALTLVSVKAFPPQASLVLLPLVALSSLRWRDHLIWATAEISYYVSVWLYIAASADPNRGLSPSLYMIFLVFRCAAVLWLAVQALRMMRRPKLDPVRAPVDALEADEGLDDPTAGVLVPRHVT